MDTDGGTPRWVKIFGGIATVVVLLFVIMLLFGDGQHGPARHNRPAPETTSSPQP